MKPLVDHLKDLLQYRELIWIWSLREIRIRYKQTVLGVAWAVLQPLALMLIFTAVFSVFARIPSDGVPYPVFSYLGLLPWTFLATSLTFGSTSLINNIHLVTKIYFPREILPIGNIFAALLDFAIASIAFFVLLIYFEIPLKIDSAWIFLLIPLQILLVVGLVLPVAAMTAVFRDLRFVVHLFLQVWMFASPVIYPLSMVPEKFRTLYLINPMASLIVCYRKVIIFGQPPDLWPLLWVFVCSVLLCILGFRYFKRIERNLADII
jgi:lipopolysaccharide transport system permease protein